MICFPISFIALTIVEADVKVEPLSVWAPVRIKIAESACNVLDVLREQEIHIN